MSDCKTCHGTGTQQVPTFDDSECPTCQGSGVACEGCIDLQRERDEAVGLLRHLADMQELPDDDKGESVLDNDTAVFTLRRLIGDARAFLEKVKS